MKKIISLFVCLTAMGSLWAQNSAMYKITELLEKNDLAGAEEIMDKALANPKTTKWQQFYNKAGEIQARKLNPELMNAAQQLPFDTLLFCGAVDKAITYYSKSHKAAVTPDEKGKVKYDKKIEAETHSKMRDMLDYYNYAAMFYFARKDTMEAIEFFQKYIDMPKDDVFTQEERDSIMASKAQAYHQTRFNIAMLNFNAKKWKETLAITKEALKDTFAIHDFFIMQQKSCLELGDTAMWVNTMVEGLNRTEDPDFAQNLLYFYLQRGDAASAEKLADDMVASSPNSKMAWYMRGCVDRDLKKDIEAAMNCFKKSIEIDPNFADGNLNLGALYINQLIDLMDNGKFKIANKGSYTKAEEAKFMAENKEILAYYVEARKYIEKAKELQPNKPRLWVYRLEQVYNNMSRIYKNLKQNNEAEELQRLYKEMEAIEESLK